MIAGKSGRAETLIAAFGIDTETVFAIVQLAFVDIFIANKSFLKKKNRLNKTKENITIETPKTVNL